MLIDSLAYFSDFSDLPPLRAPFAAAVSAWRPSAARCKCTV